MTYFSLIKNFFYSILFKFISRINTSYKFKKIFKIFLRAVPILKPALIRLRRNSQIYRNLPCMNENDLKVYRQLRLAIAKQKRHQHAHRH
jgi:hypothetical protein